MYCAQPARTLHVQPTVRMHQGLCLLSWRRIELIRLHMALSLPTCCLSMDPCVLIEHCSGVTVQCSHFSMTAGEKEPDGVAAGKTNNRLVRTSSMQAGLACRPC